MTSAYYDTIQLIERLHRYFLDVVKTEIDRKGIQDINNIQAMILHNVGSDEMTVGELTLRGYYLGSNVSYNVKKMTENGYIAQERSVHDKRSIRVKLTDNGRDLHKLLDEVFKKHETKLAEQKIENADLVDLNHTMKQLERFWASQTSFSGMTPSDLEDF